LHASNTNASASIDLTNEDGSDDTILYCYVEKVKSKKVKKMKKSISSSSEKKNWKSCEKSKGKQNNLAEI